MYYNDIILQVVDFFCGWRYLQINAATTHIHNARTQHMTHTTSCLVIPLLLARADILLCVLSHLVLLYIVVMDIHRLVTTEADEDALLQQVEQEWKQEGGGGGGTTATAAATTITTTETPASPIISRTSSLDEIPSSPGNNIVTGEEEEDGLAALKVHVFILGDQG